MAETVNGVFKAGRKVVKIPGQRRIKLAKWLLKQHPLHQEQTFQQAGEPVQDSIKIVCISDTHNKQPALPHGDVLVHAGDLTDKGGFDEIQSQLDWLSAQPHKHKILIAGNHDVLLDQKFLEKYPERRYGDSRTARDLNWGSVTYLQDATITLQFEFDDTQHSKTRHIKIFGSPWTPEYGVSAFQYPREEDIWSNRLPSDIDLLITHGPPRLYQDQTNIHNAGCPYLAKRIAEIRPKLVVFGHIHVARGRQDVVLDTPRALHDEIVNRWGSYWSLSKMIVAVATAKCNFLMRKNWRTQQLQRTTSFVNAAVVGGPKNELANEPIVLYI